MSSIQANNRLEGLRSHIPARAKVRQGRSVDREVLGDLLLIRATDITATHVVESIRAAVGGNLDWNCEFRDIAGLR